MSLIRLCWVIFKVMAYNCSASRLVHIRLCVLIFWLELLCALLLSVPVTVFCSISNCLVLKAFRYLYVR